MKIIQQIIPVFLFCCLLSGCGFKDLDKRFFVTAIGVDKTKSQEKPWRVTLKLVVPSAKIEPGKENFQIVQEDSKSIAQAIIRLKSKVDKELDFGQTKIIMFGEELAKEDISKVMDWFERRRDIQNIAYVTIGEPDAETILKIKPKSERLPANALILSFGQVGTESPYVVTEYVFDFHRRQREKGLDPVIPIVKKVSAENYAINTVALLDKKKVKMVLNPEDTRTLNHFLATVPKFTIDVDTNKDRFSYSVETAKLSYKIITPPNGKPYADIHVKLTGILEESDERIKKERWKEYEKEINETSEKRVVEVLKKIQKTNLDPVGFGLRYRSSHGRQAWDEWQKIYPELEFRAHVDASIKMAGKIF